MRSASGPLSAKQTEPAGRATRRPIRTRLRLSPQHAAGAVALFIIEVAIALVVHDGFVRPYVGDVLVVLLIHQAVRAVLDLPSTATAVATLAFAYAVEGAQYAGIGRRLDGHPILQTVIGTTFQLGDLLAYAVGALVAVGGDAVAAAVKEARG